MKVSAAIRSLAIGTVLAATASSTSAALIAVNVTTDLKNANISSSLISAGRAFGNTVSRIDPVTRIDPVSVATGDTLIINMDFLGNQQLTVNGLTLAWPFLVVPSGSAASAVNMNGTLELLGSDNSVVASASKTSVAMSAHVGQGFNGADFRAIASVTFAGLRYTGTVNSQDVNPRSYDAANIRFAGSSVSVSEFPSKPNEVPEPSTIVLFSLALAGLGMSRMRKH